MQTESRIPIRTIKTLAIFLMLATAFAVPGWLYYKRGRKLPLRVVLEAERYVVRAGGSLALSARILPPDVELDESRWEGPGVASPGDASLNWQAPKKPGLYAVRFMARRGASWSEDALSLRVLPRSPASYPLSSPPTPLAPPTIETPCARAEAARFEVHGTRCRGAQVVVELKTAAPWRKVWMTSVGSATKRATRGRFRLLRLADEAGAARQIEATIVDSKARCVHRYETNVVAEDCVGGPRRGALFADFQWELANPGLFRLAAKPPREGQKRVRYHWTLGGKKRSSDKPHLIHRFERRARHYVVALEIEADGERAKGVGLLMDRSFEGR